MQHAQKFSRRSAGPLARLAQRRSFSVVTKCDAFALTRSRGSAVVARRPAPRGLAIGTGAVGLYVLLLQQPAYCMDGGEPVDESTPLSMPEAPVDAKPSDGATDFADFIQSDTFKTGSRISFGLLAGYSSGYAIKKVGRVALLFVGLSFIALQTLRYFGYINVDWLKVRDDIVKAVDTDGDGHITRADITTQWRRLMAVLSYNIPGRAAFAAAALMGFRHG